MRNPSNLLKLKLCINRLLLIAAHFSLFSFYTRKKKVTHAFISLSTGIQTERNLLDVTPNILELCRKGLSFRTHLLSTRQ